MSRRLPLLLLVTSFGLGIHPARAFQNDRPAGQLPAELRGVKVYHLAPSFPVDLRPFLGKNKRSWGYIHLEARTQNITGEEFRCYTNPVWLEITDN